jgi:molecular chaperone DnaK
MEIAMRLGIDIGTHTARAAYLDEDGRPRLVRFAQGADALPALARQTIHGLVVGEEAARALVGNAETTVCGCTRLMGRASSLPPTLLARLPYHVREENGEAVCELLYAEVAASEVYGSIVGALVEAAERETGRRVESVVLTVPASVEDRFRVQARAAAEALGVRVQRLVNQPAAALLQIADCRLPIEDDLSQSAICNLQSAIHVAVVSCGGGSTEVSIAERTGQGWRVLSTAADPTLGGDDFAWELAGRLNERFRRAAGLDVVAVGDSRVAAAGLRVAAEEALRRLSQAPATTLVIDHGGGFGRDLVAPISRAEADSSLRPALDRVADLCARALGSLPQRTQRTQRVDAALLIGDWAFLPQLQDVVAAALHLPPELLHTAQAETLAVMGAALLTADTAAAVWDVTPYPLGISCYFGEQELLSPIIPANTPIPTAPTGFTQHYSTRYPDQREVRLDVLQYRGARDAQPYGAGRVRPGECELLASWSFDGLSPWPGACAGFSVTFAVDADGILSLEARETATGRTLRAQIDRGVG